MAGEANPFPAGGEADAGKERQAWIASRLAWEGQAPSAEWNHADEEKREIARQVIWVKNTWFRNMAGFPFLIASQENQVQMALENAAQWASQKGWRPCRRLADIPRESLLVLRERLILPWHPVTFPQSKAFKGVALEADEVRPSLSGAGWALFGEEDHLQIGHIRPPWESDPEFSAKTDAWESATGPFAHSEVFGFLTADPGKAGLARQMEIAIHLPALTANRLLAQAHEGLKAMGILMQPEPMGSVNGMDAGYFRLGSRGGLGLDLNSRTTRFWDAVKALLRWEAKARSTWWRKDGILLKDRMRRSYRMLSEAQLLPLHEALGFLSFVRLGMVMGEIDPAGLSRVERARILAQNGHLGLPPRNPEETDALDAHRRLDIRRAECVREIWPPSPA